MKFRYALVAAFFMTAVLLLTNAYQIFSFEKTSSSRSSFSANQPELQQFADAPLTAPKRYGESIALSTSQNRITNILSTTLPKNSCIEVFDAPNGQAESQPFIAINPTQQLVPASTNKIITAAVVLSVLDPDSTLDTSLIAESKSSTLSRAYIKTSGDPSFVTSKIPPSRRPSYLSPTHVHTFEDFASKTYSAGVRSITNLVIDNTWFDLDAIESGWSKDKEQVGALAALNADEGYEGNALAASADTHAAALLKSVFTAKGITINNITFGAIPEKLSKSDSVIAQTSSASVKELVSDMLKTSDNVYAEQLLAAAVYASGGNVTKRSRADFVSQQLKKLSIDASGYVFINGSGYTTNARSTCALENDVVDAMNSRDIDLVKLSSHANHDGTLAKRFTNLPTDLYAKTGTLNGVTALTGLLGDDILFSFISNGSFSEEGGKALQESVVSTLSRFPFVVAPKFPDTFGQGPERSAK